MTIIFGKNNESFGFVQEGCFSNRLYIFENEDLDEERTALQRNASQLPGAGIASYGNFIGFILSYFSLASTISIGEQTFYINNESFCHYILRKAAHKGNNGIGAMHDYYVKNKNGVEGIVYDEATVKKVNECFLSRVENSEVSVELWELIEACIEASSQDLSIDSIEDEESVEAGQEITQEIEKFVRHFLWPYITNQVDPNAPEEIDRAPMFETLIDHLETKFGRDKEFNEFEEVALDTYILAATEGLFQNKHIEEGVAYFKVFLDELVKYYQKQMKKDEEYHELMKWYIRSFKAELEVSKSESETESNESEYEPRLPSKDCLILLQALVPALEKDFPHLSLDNRKLVDKIYDAVENIKDKRKNDTIVETMNRLRTERNQKQNEAFTRKESTQFKVELFLKNLKLKFLY